MNSFEGCVSYFTLGREFREEGRHSTRRCPLWVKSRHSQCKTACPLYPESRHVQCKGQCLLWANSGLMQSSNRLYSITSAVICMTSGTVTPRDFAVLRLNSVSVGAWWSDRLLGLSRGRFGVL